MFDVTNIRKKVI